MVVKISPTKASGGACSIANAKTMACSGDGVSDKKDLWFAGGARGGNLEHQQSGLVWCLDNWMYQATNSFRLRWTGILKCLRCLPPIPSTP